jgi:uncharacterized membrane protein
LEAVRRTDGGDVFSCAMSEYNRLAGRGIERIAALTDGLFSIAMTLIVLEVKVPDHGSVHGEVELLAILGALTPRLVTYLMSFLTLGIFWVGLSTQLGQLERADRHYTWLQLCVLAVVALLPFSTELLAEFISYRVALLVYWFNILLFGIAVYVCWHYARGAGLYKPTVTPKTELAFRNRVLRAQSLYAFGAALCVVNTYCSIAFIVLVQLVYAIAPRVKWVESFVG